MNPSRLSFAEKFSPQLLDRLVGPFVSGIYAGDPERLSIRSAFPQLYEAEKAAGSITRGMIRLAKSKKGPRERPTLQSFREGSETLVRALGNKLGTALLTQTSATGIYLPKGRFIRCSPGKPWRRRICFHRIFNPSYAH